VINKIRDLMNRNGQPAPGQPTNGHGAAAPESVAIAQPPDFAWRLEVRSGSELLGTMQSQNPMALVSHFHEYTVLYGDPVPEYTVWLANTDSDRRAPLSYQGGEAAWLSFLRELDPQIDDAMGELADSVTRTTMVNPGGQPVNADTLFEQVFGQG
jgi:hypothetical protein